MNTPSTSPRSEAAAFADRYVAVWNQPDPERWREGVAALWAEDAEYFNALKAYRGHDGLFTAVTRSHEKWIGDGYIFRALGDVVSHHDGLKLRWEMVPADAQSAARLAALADSAVPAALRASV